MILLKAALGAAAAWCCPMLSQGRLACHALCDPGLRFILWSWLSCLLAMDEAHQTDVLASQVHIKHRWSPAPSLPCIRFLLLLFPNIIFDECCSQSCTAC